MQRRHFLTTTAASLATFGATPLLASKSGKKYRTAVIGSGWWGMNIHREALTSGTIETVALCDVDENVLNNAAGDVEADTGKLPQTFKDYRELLEKTKPEVVIIGTPDHWHALQSIAACKAGAHVYVEKPTGHTINESRAMVKTAQDAGVVVQVGLHRRIGPHHVEAMNFLRSGALGKVGLVKCFVNGKGAPETPKPNIEPPEGMDWDFYCGPSPLRPFNAKIHPGGWRGYLDFSNGTMGDWGVHWLDQILWWSGEKGPKNVFCTGGRPIFGPVILNEKEQTTDAPDHQMATFEFEQFTATWEHRKFGDNAHEAPKIGTCFYGEKGMLHIGWKDGWTFYPTNDKAAGAHGDSKVLEPDGQNIALLWTDFMEAIENKRKPAADIESAHRSSCLPLLGMLSWRAGRSIAWDADKEQIIGDADASKLLGRVYRVPWEYPTI